MSYAILPGLVRSTALSYPIATNAQIALKTVTAELPLDGTVAPRAIQKLVPKLLQQLGSVRNQLNSHIAKV